MSKVDVITLFCGSCCNNTQLMSAIRSQSRPFQIRNSTMYLQLCGTCNREGKRVCDQVSCKRAESMYNNYLDMINMFGNLQLPLLAYPDGTLISTHRNVLEALQGNHAPIIKSKNIEERREHYERLNLPFSANLADVRYYYNKMKVKHKDKSSKKFREIEESFHILEDFLK